MAHFAKIGEAGRVLEVVVVNNNVIQDLPFPESEPIGVEFLVGLFGPATWKQTSYNHNFRKRYATPNGTYDPVLDVFINPKPFASWLFNTETCDWDPPVPRPADTETTFYWWDEINKTWVAEQI